MEKAVRKATKPKCAAPKAKYLKVLIEATSDEIALTSALRYLNHRLKEHSWTVVFKSLIVVHVLMRKGANTRVLNCLVRDPTILNVSSFRDKSGTQGAEQTKNIHTYAAYIEEKVAVYRDLKVDFVREKLDNGESRLRQLPVEKGLLREVEVLQRQIAALLNCKFFIDEVNNEVTLTAFRLLVEDLLTLFQATNEGVINVLEHYIEMSRVDAKTSLQIYKKYVQQTEKVVDYLSIAKKMRAALGMSVPNLKHAPTSLTATLEDYVNDPDFEENRRKYKLSKEDKNKDLKQDKQPVDSKNSSNSTPKNTVKSVEPSVPSNVTKTSSKEKEFIDFFSSIEQEQTLIFGPLQTYSPTNSLNRSVTNPFIGIQHQRINEFSSQPQITQSPVTPHDTNPFRSTILGQDMSSNRSSTLPSVQQNPFQSPISTSSYSNPFTSMNTIQSQPLSPLSPQSMQITQIQSNPILDVDSNPFRRSMLPTTFNPFPQSMPQGPPINYQIDPMNSNDSSFPINQFQTHTAGNLTGEI
ncbi:ANTH-domain-containing protein [Gigaspora margarita]|uniref:ANTH-domain-containing protein n=1 Tax=Gigaspora margarita TaxID=4874 RepID=A0A8H3XC91_GIGMA|nr:ANTH-domain-containing protein [Gigaspora margarita]